MIRKRNPVLDDRHIYRLIVEELLPYSRQSFAADEVTRGAIRQRLNREVTRVAAPAVDRPAYGFISFFHKKGTLFVDMLAVSRRRQGRGFGMRLMQCAERYGRRRGCGKAMLFVDQDNERARSFYLRLGYSVESFDQRIVCYLLSKKLS